MGVLLTKIIGTPDFGPYMLAGDDYLLIHSKMREDPKGLREIVEALEVSEYIFYEPRREVGNDNGIVFSHVAPESEVERIAKALKADLNVGIVKTRFTALRNNVLVNNRGGLVNPELFSKERDTVKALEDVLGVELIPARIANVPLPGSVAVANDRGVFIHAEASDREIEIVKKALKVEQVIRGRVNGSPYVSVGLVANNKGIVIGDETDPEDVMNAVEALLGIRKSVFEI